MLPILTTTTINGWVFRALRTWRGNYILLGRV
jgi:hypothetical protein